MRPTFTLGIEEEYQTIDPETRDLRSHIATEMLAQGKLRLKNVSKPKCISLSSRSALASVRTSKRLAKTSTIFAAT